MDGISITSNACSDGEPLKINVGGVIRSRLPRQARFIPTILIRLLERIIRQDALNELLLHNAGLTGADFARGLLRDLDVTYNIIGREHMPEPADTRVVYISNHPLGALDGIALIDMVARHHGCQPLFVVNDLLMAVKPLRPVFVPVNKHGAQTRGAAASLRDAFEGGAPVIVFPAGLVSRRMADGSIADLQWRTMALHKAIEHRRDIIPLYFNAHNSRFFYKFARLRQRSGLKFNIEMALLPGEIFKCRHHRFPIAVGERVRYSGFKGGISAQREMEMLRQTVYNLGKSLQTDQ